MWRVGGEEYWRLEIVRKTWTLWFFPSYDALLYEVDEDPELGILYTVPISVMDAALCKERKKPDDEAEPVGL